MSKVGELRPPWVHEGNRRSLGGTQSSDCRGQACNERRRGCNPLARSGQAGPPRGGCCHTRHMWLGASEVKFLRHGVHIVFPPRSFMDETSLDNG